MPIVDIGFFRHVQRTKCFNRPGKKTEGPSTSLVYLGYLLDTIKSQIKIPGEKVPRLLELIDNALSHKKLTLKELQSLTGSLQFYAKAMPSTRAFIRRMYASISNVKKKHIIAYVLLRISRKT